MHLATHTGCFHRCQYQRQKLSNVLTLLTQLTPWLMGWCKLEHSTSDVPDYTVSSIGCKDYNGGNRRFQCSVQVCEAFNIQHVNLIYKQYTRDQLCDALINVFIYHFIYFSSKFIYENQNKLLITLLASNRFLWRLKAINRFPWKCSWFDLLMPQDKSQQHWNSVEIETKIWNFSPVLWRHLCIKISLNWTSCT